MNALRSIALLIIEQCCLFTAVMLSLWKWTVTVQARAKSKELKVVLAFDWRAWPCRGVCLGSFEIRGRSVEQRTERARAFVVVRCFDESTVACLHTS